MMHIEEDFRKIESQMRVWRKRHKSYHPLEITYEGFVANNDKTTKTLLDFLGANKRESLSLLLRKVSVKKLEDSVGNFEVLKY